MDDTQKPDAQALSHVLDALETAANGGKVSVGDLVDALGRHSFAALVLAPSLIAVSPASSIPGLTSTIGLLVAVITLQMLLGRQSVWLPGILTRRQISSDRLCTALNWLRRPVAFLERLTRPRLVALVSRPLVVLPLSIMLVIGLLMPLLEVIPMSGSIAGALISLYAMGLLMRDGALVLLAMGMSIAAPLGVWQLAT